MTNYEKHEKDLAECGLNDNTCRFACEHIKECDDLCKTCNINNCEKCTSIFYDWLQQWHDEHITISLTEYHILKGVLDSEFNYITRNHDGNICLHSLRPWRINDAVKEYKHYWLSDGKTVILEMFSHLFQFVKNDNDEAFRIQELIDIAIVKEG